ncbi:MAG: acyl-CoA dehydratase activase [Myxococcota bacterium]|nr:acyl-CoA dehydratase activase [Myxococcota bacterium]
MTEPLLYGGVDAGASATKAVLLDGNGALVAEAICQSGMDFARASQAAFEAALRNAGKAIKDVRRVVATGYGRKNAAFARSTKTEIACHARGAYDYFKEALTLVDIGGQDNKVICIAADGTRLDFKMNRKCAAGTGAFLEEIARRMNLSLEEMGTLALKSTAPVEISSFCTVFAATEILALVRQGAKTPDIAKGAYQSVVKRVLEMDPLEGKVAATGGVVAHNPIAVALLSEATGKQVALPPNPQFTGAIGAALFAMDETLEG